MGKTTSTEVKTILQFRVPQPADEFWNEFKNTFAQPQSALTLQSMFNAYKHRGELEEELEKRDALLESKEKEISELRSELETKQEYIDKMNSEIETVTHDCENLREEKESLQNRIDTLQAETDTEAPDLIEKICTLFDCNRDTLIQTIADYRANAEKKPKEVTVEVPAELPPTTLLLKNVTPAEKFLLNEITTRCQCDATEILIHRFFMVYQIRGNGDFNIPKLKSSYVHKILDNVKL